ncbi:hypothetical protein MRX96_029160 [Rhipicephalus microplus]
MTIKKVGARISNIPLAQREASDEQSFSECALALSLCPITSNGCVVNGDSLAVTAVKAPAAAHSRATAISRRKKRRALRIGSPHARTPASASGFRRERQTSRPQREASFPRACSKHCSETWTPRCAL